MTWTGMSVKNVAVINLGIRISVSISLPSHSPLGPLSNPHSFSIYRMPRKRSGSHKKSQSSASSASTQPSTSTPAPTTVTAITEHPTMSLSKQNYARPSEEAVNIQINSELAASQTYLSMSAWCGRDNVALPGFEKFFRKAAEEEREHAQALIDYHNKRGGRVRLEQIPAPEVSGMGC
jgi:hypothetical protein